MFEEFPVMRILSDLERDDLLPAILFRSARKQCDTDLEFLSGMRRGGLSPAGQERLRRELDAIAAKYGLEPDVISAHNHYPVLLATGVGAHHAGQLLAWRLVLEELMSRGALRMMIATGTVAAGVDFPARTAIITAHSKRGAEGFRVLTASELQQMSGRAGRRGRDAVGICLVAPGPYCDARVIHEVAQRPPEPLRSVYFAAPSTVLNLLKHRNVDDLRYTVDKSLASFLDRKGGRALRAEAREKLAEVRPDMKAEQRKRIEKKARRLEKDAEILESKQVGSLEESLAGLTALGYVEPGGLTEKGTWAAELCTSLVLELAEAIEEGLFDSLTPVFLAGMVASIAGDPHRTYFGLAANPVPKASFAALTAVIEKVRASYRNPSTTELAVVPDAALTVMTWADAGRWSEFAGLLRLAGAAEGDVARLVTQTADHLAQLNRLTITHPKLATAAAEARRLILRPPLSEANG